MGDTPRSDIDVKNLDERTAYVKMSKTLGEGQDQYFAIPTGDTERWRRHIGRRTTIKLGFSGDGPVVQSVDRGGVR